MPTPGTFDGKPVARWIIPRLVFARSHGWTGHVVSGYRSPADQIRVGTEYARQLGKPVSAVYPNGLTASNHCRLTAPGGAVDVTEPEQLHAAMLKWPEHHQGRPLRWGWLTIRDRPHFSANGH